MCVCSVGEQCANESFSVTLWLKVYHFSSQDDSLANVCVLCGGRPAVCINL